MSGEHRSWYMELHKAQPRGGVQAGNDLVQSVRERRQFTLPEHVLRLAQSQYEHHFGRQQDYERMQERGGLSITEVIGLLADYCDRLGGQPTKPRPPSHDSEAGGRGNG